MRLAHAHFCTIQDKCFKSAKLHRTIKWKISFSQRYATDDTVAEADLDLMNFKHPAIQCTVKYAQSL